MACSSVLWITQGALAQGAPDIVWEVEGHAKGVEAVAFSADGQMLASGSGDATAKLWRTSDGMLLDTFPGVAGGVFSVDLSSDNQYLAAGYIAGTYPPGGLTDLWTLEHHEMQDTFGGYHVSFSADSEFIATGGGGVNRYVFVNRTSTGQEMWYAYTGAYLGDVKYSPDGTLVATGGTHNLVQLWNAETGASVRELSGHTNDISAVAFSPDGKTLASAAGGWDGPGEAHIKVWRVSDGALLRTLEGHGSWTYAVAFSPDGRTLISSGRDHDSPYLTLSIRFWDVETGELLQMYDEEVNNGVPTVAFSPDGQYFAYGRGDRRVVLAWNPIAPPCSDFDGDGEIDVTDLLMLLAAWGTCTGCAQDINHDGSVDVTDLLTLIAAWGPCP